MDEDRGGMASLSNNRWIICSMGLVILCFVRVG